MDQLAQAMEGRCLPVQEKKTTEKMHTPYAGIILFRFEGTFSAWPVLKQDAGTPGAFFR